MKPVQRFVPLLSLLLLIVFAAPVWGQGILVDIESSTTVRLPRPHISVPRPEPAAGSYKIKDLAVNAKIEEQVARVQVSQSFVNTGSTQMEVCFMFPLPYDGAIDQLTLMVDGKEFPAKLLEAKEARKLYEEIVRKNQDPALLEWVGTGLFRTSVFPVPPGSERKVTLRYSQLCRSYEGLTDFLFPLSTAKYTSHPIEKLNFQLTIESKSDIKNIYSPNQSLEIKRPDEKHATVSFTKTNEVPTSDFRLFYDVGKGKLATTVLSYRPKEDEEGYFLLLTSPEIKDDGQRPQKTVVFVVDRSGSMSGEKIEQAKGALKFVLNNLREDDLFNVIAYDSEVESWKPELQKFSDENRKGALAFVESIYAGGSTNIGGALDAALAQLADDSQPSYVIFLTDGLPTTGETAEAKIVASTEEANKVRARVFSFGVGYDVNSRLLDKLASVNHGHSQYVRPNENIEEHVSKFYARISSPVMTDVSIKFDVEGLDAEEGQPVSRVYPKKTLDLFAGEQLVLVGRYRKGGSGKVSVTGKVGSGDSTEQKFDFPAKLAEKTTDDSFAFVEKLWAVRRVGEIIDEIDLKGKNDELIKELVSLSTKHGILTPYTSFMADENTNLHDLASNVQEAEVRLRMLDNTEGRWALGQRAAKSQLQRADNLSTAGPNLDWLADAEDQAAPASAARPALAAGVAGGPLPKERGGRANEALGRFYSSPGHGDSVARTSLSKSVAQNVRTVGNRSFYKRGEQWVDSTLTKEQQESPVALKRYSTEWFELIDKHGPEVAKYMTIDEPVIVGIDGQAYSF